MYYDHGTCMYYVHSACMYSYYSRCMYNDHRTCIYYDHSTCIMSYRLMFNAIHVGEFGGAKPHRECLTLAITSTPPSLPHSPSLPLTSSPYSSRINNLTCSLIGPEVVQISVSNIRSSGRQHVRFSVDEAIQHASRDGGFKLIAHDSCGMAYSFRVLEDRDLVELVSFTLGFMFT